MDRWGGSAGWVAEMGREGGSAGWVDGGRRGVGRYFCCYLQHFGHLGMQLGYYLLHFGDQGLPKCSK